MPHARRPLRRGLPLTLVVAALVPGLALGGCAASSADEGARETPVASSAGTSTGTASTGAMSEAGPPATGGPASPVGSTSAPPPASVPERGDGKAEDVDVPGQDTPADGHSGRTVRYTVEVEGGLESLAADFPAAVRTYLTDRRGWQTQDGLRFVHVTPAQRAKGASTDIRIIFASPSLVDQVCAPLRTNGRLSCHDDGQVMINAWRWVNGADTYDGDLASYRIYLVNHEVGHSIGHSHASCPRAGAQAPVMLQQTLRLEGCRPYPYPVG